MGNKKFIFVNADGEHEEDTQSVSSRVNAGDADKLIKTDGSGYIANTFINTSALEALLDHGGLTGKGDDDHSLYTKADGTRDFSGNQSMGSFKLTGLGTPTAAADAVTKAYTDAVAEGLAPKGNVDVATDTAPTGDNVEFNAIMVTGAFSSTNATYGATLIIAGGAGALTLDGYSVQVGDSILVKDAASPKMNGIYEVFSLTDNAGNTDVELIRRSDQDNSPLAEVVNGVFIPLVINGTINADRPYVLYSIGLGTDDAHILEDGAAASDDILFQLFSSPTALNPGNGIDPTAFASNSIVVKGDVASTTVTEANAIIVGANGVSIKVDNDTLEGSLGNTAGAEALRIKDAGVDKDAMASSSFGQGVKGGSGSLIEADLTSNGGLKFTGNTPNGTLGTDYANTSVSGDLDGTNPGKIMSAEDLYSYGANQGARVLGADSTTIPQSSATNIQGVLEDLSVAIGDAEIDTLAFTVKAGSNVILGGLVQIDGNDIVKHLDITDKAKSVGIAKTAQAENTPVSALQDGELAIGALSGATAGIPYYWTGSILSTSMPSASGSRVWKVGHAVNTTDLYIDIEFIKKNA